MTLKERLDTDKYYSLAIKENDMPILIIYGKDTNGWYCISQIWINKPSNISCHYITEWEDVVEWLKSYDGKDIDYYEKLYQEQENANE